MAVNSEGILEIVDGIDQKHTDGHRRLRETLTAYVERLERLEEAERRLTTGHQANDARITDFERKPIDVSKLMAPSRIVVGIVTTVVVVFGGAWGITGSLRSDLRNVLTRMETEQRVSDANAKFIETNITNLSKAFEANTANINKSLDEIRRRQDMLTLQYNELNDKITRLSAERR